MFGWLRGRRWVKQGDHLVLDGYPIRIGHWARPPLGWPLYLENTDDGRMQNHLHLSVAKEDGERWADMIDTFLSC
jgi:hypothetical protein